jgi:hypothetical protein
MGDRLNFNGGYRFFLKVAFAYLVVSVFLPVAFVSLPMHVYFLYPTGYDGPYYSTDYRKWVFYWSFMWVEETVSTSLLTPEPSMIGTRVGFLPDYGDWGPPLRSTLTQSIFPLQMVLIILGFLTVKKARRALSIIPFLLGVTILAALCYYTAHLYWAAQLYWGPLSFGFWILVVVTLFTSIALTRAKK